MSKQTNNNEDEDIVVTLTLDDGVEIDCEILTIFTVEKQDYIALLPPEGHGFEEGEALLYRFFEDDELPRIENIESEEEYEIAADAFDEWMDTAEYDELYLDLDDEED